MDKPRPTSSRPTKFRGVTQSERRERFIDNVRLALQWINDARGEEIIESPGYTRSYLYFDQGTSDEDVRKISLIVNTVLLLEEPPGTIFVTYKVRGVVPPYLLVRIYKSL